MHYAECNSAIQQSGTLRYLEGARQRRSRSALPITTRSDNPMAAAQRIGLMNPSAASGTPTAL